MRLLLDTNILILRENYHEIPEHIQSLYKIIEQLQYQRVIHPLSIQEIKKDGNIERRKANISKIESYVVLSKVPKAIEDKSFYSKLNIPKSENDSIDNELLYCVYKNIVDFLITEDQELLHKGDILDIQTVISPREAIEIFSEYLLKTDIHSTPSFCKKKGFEINLEDTIFDTLKHDYHEFTSYWWPNKVIKQDRDVYTFIDNENRINALLIPKIETKNEIDFIAPVKFEKILKICLFKVAEIARGKKLGERLISMAIDYAIQNNLAYIYLTHFTEENDYLVPLINSFGFEYVGKNSRDEEVFLKSIIAPSTIDVDKYDIHEISKKYYPSYYDGEKVKKHLVPIIPRFHKMLFPDYDSYRPIRQGTLLTLHPNSEGNSIKKAYLSHSTTGKVSSGDILLFYRTEDDMMITTLGIVEKVERNLTDAEKIQKITAKRTVYSKDDIEKLSKSSTIVILFNQHFHFRKPVSYDYMLKENIITGPIQSISKISDENYRKIIKDNINVCFTIN